MIYIFYCILKYRILCCKVSYVYLVFLLIKNVVDGFNMFRVDIIVVFDDGCVSSYLSFNVFNIVGGGYIVMYFGK